MLFNSYFQRSQAISLKCTAYHSNVVSLLNLQARMLFVQTHYTLATEEAERIGVDHVARLSNTGTVDTSTGFI